MSAHAALAAPRRGALARGAPMRILHVTPTYLPALRYGGTVHAVHGLCEALVQAGHDVDVFTTTVDGPGEVAHAPGAPVEIDGVRVHYHRVPTLRRLYWSPSLARRLREAVASYDIVHVHALFLHPVTSAANAARRTGVPLVMAPRGMLVRELFRRRSSLAKRLWLAGAGRLALEAAAAVHVTSALEACEVARFGLDLREVLVVPNGISAPPPPRVDRRPGRVLYLGRLSWKKGLEMLLEAIARVPRVELRIVGNDEENLTPRLEALAHRLGIRDRVEVKPAVSRDERWREYRAAGAFVLPSLSENFANTVLESLAMATPVVVTPGVGLAEFVRRSRAGMVCEPSVTALAAAIESLAAAPPRAAAMGENGRRAVLAEFPWPRVAARMDDVYRRLRSAVA